tara:strand:- start:4185 stop:4475 length:291 start_codon:yes stop_codon:yes gene_type:complete
LLKVLKKLIFIVFLFSCSQVDNFIKDTNGKEHFYAHSPIFTEGIQDSIELYCYYHQEYEKIFQKPDSLTRSMLKKIDNNKKELEKWQEVVGSYRMF